MIGALSIQQTKELFAYLAEQFAKNKAFLTEIDSAIGDGDHGIGMALGFARAAEVLAEKDCETVNDVFHHAGMAMLGSMGGASGVIFGTMFMGGAKRTGPFGQLDLEALTALFSSSLEAIKQRGKAELGDKTMIDAYEPAVCALRQCCERAQTLLEGLQVAEEKAREGMEQTKAYQAKFGRAKSLGERAVGHQDAGATSVWLIFRSMREWVERIGG
ncbi:dihydroxyacetone kinase subunit DhaL [Brevibacillus marinus]|uniref:dihydroxyacetone kinase subunit DhaL n=1 Tax=Brevibacillus marinus TaxID=2496837 RepID=UPI0013DEDE34|nr:dihydroxyacetone kinase subunit DhaL [Brevibacillus marinus]